MLKGKSGDKVFLGLSKINIEKLQDGYPMAFNLNELGLPDQRIIIFAGDTEQTMAKELSQNWIDE